MYYARVHRLAYVYFERFIRVPKGDFIMGPKVSVLIVRLYLVSNIW